MFQLTGNREQDCAEALAHLCAVRAHYEALDQSTEVLAWRQLELVIGTERDLELCLLELAYPHYDRLSDRDAGDTRDHFDGLAEDLAKESLSGQRVGAEQTQPVRKATKRKRTTA